MPKVNHLAGQVIWAAGSADNQYQATVSQWGAGECGIEDAPGIWDPVFTLGNQHAGRSDINIGGDGAIIFRRRTRGGHTCDLVRGINNDRPGRSQGFGEN